MNPRTKIILGYCGLCISMSSVFFGLLIRDDNMMVAIFVIISITLAGGLLTWFTVFKETKEEIENE